MNDNKVITFLILLFCTLYCSACTFSDEHSFVEDRAGLLTDKEQEHLILYNNALLKDFDIHFKLVILDEKTDNIKKLAVDLFGKLGEKTRGAKGLLFLVDPEGQQVRIEVGYDLEATFPDAFVWYLERAQMVPFFQGGKIGAGIEATTELFIARAVRMGAGMEFDRTVELGALDHYSGGGGSKIQISPGAPENKTKNHHDLDKFKPQLSPEMSLDTYKNVLRFRVKEPNLELFTPKTRKFFSGWVVTDAQQNNELRTLEQEAPEQTIINNDYAVIRYPMGKRTIAPYFFQKRGGRWMLDFWTMSQVIRMNHRNMWMLKSFNHPYMFAFSDWAFDKNGFPISKN